MWRLLELQYGDHCPLYLTELRHYILGRLQHCKDIGGVKNIKQLKFSPSGHLVAAANSREILLICAYTWKINATLKVSLNIPYRKFMSLNVPGDLCPGQFETLAILF